MPQSDKASSYTHTFYEHVLAMQYGEKYSNVLVYFFKSCLTLIMLPFIN